MSADRASFGDLLRRLRSAASLSQEASPSAPASADAGSATWSAAPARLPWLETVRLLADALSDVDRTALLAAARAGTASPRHVRISTLSAGCLANAADPAHWANRKSKPSSPHCGTTTSGW